MVATPNGAAAINNAAPPILVTAGSGDVLFGIIAVILFQGMEAFDAACAGVYVHGLAADAYFDQGRIATDLPQMLPIVFTKLQSKINGILNS